MTEVVQSTSAYTDVAYDDGTDRPALAYIHTLPSDEWRAQLMDPMGNLAGTVNLDSIGVPHTWDAWGGNTSTTWDGMDALGWKGLMPETGSGLIYMRARWYDPELGRFISEDPAGLSGGINPYVFAGDDPINSSDPSGMLVGDPDPALQLCQSRGGIYVQFSNGTTACSAYPLPPANITARADAPFGGDEPADTPPWMQGPSAANALFLQVAAMGGKMPLSKDPTAAWARCTEQAIADNGVSLGVDLAGAFVPEGSLVKLAVGTAGSVNSMFHADMVGIIGGPTSTTLDAFNAAEKNGSH